ncbi:ParM/StbA family protein [Clostridium perfringens]|uniref:ParM/StbA family protein n=1 Tax=Clostridium perfringens TaxID=1502 RepID=UPI0013E37B47|nr:ParM/StbA family protein [Clostridium perfringens]NGT56575.1 ParM/StbA family protein [Clostridium perfringens]NGT56649.1 ParM/StbA family protein [Clostridium perfringens]NGT56723.1 ParM/StbA family protein [Clostridium perfringens]
MILGLDIGNITSICIGEDTEFIVESRIKDYEELNSFSTTDIVEIDGRKMLFNEGYFENNIIKHEKENFLNLVYYTIAKTLEGTNESAVKIVIGVPAGQYNSEKDNLKKLINQNCCKTININGEYKTVTIEDVFIAPEGYGVKIEALKNLDNKAKTLIVDIGGGTTDVAEFDENGRFIGGKSIKTGLLDLYKEVQEVLDIKYKLNVSLEDAKKYFDGELDVRNDNFEVETEYKKEILLKLIKYLVNELRGYYPNLKQYNLVLSGGAAKRVHPVFKKLYPQTQAVTDIKANAKGFRKVGLAKWQKK